MLPNLNAFAILDPRSASTPTAELLPEDATTPLASFASSLQAAIPLAPPDDAPLTVALPALPADGGETLPVDGNALPAALEPVLQALVALADETPSGPAPTNAAPSDGDGASPIEGLPAQRIEPDAKSGVEDLLRADIAATGERPTPAGDGGARETNATPVLRQPDWPILEPLPRTADGLRRADPGAIPAGAGERSASIAGVRQPPGIELERSLEPTLAGDRVAGPVSPGLPGREDPLRQAEIERLARLVDAPVARVQTTLEDRAIPVADLKRLVDGLKERLRRAEAGVSATEPAAGRTQRIDLPSPDVGRYRPIGVGVPSRSFVGLDVNPGALPAEDALTTESLRQESLLAPKPKTGGLQIHAPSVSVTQGLSQGLAQTERGSEFRLVSDAIQTPVRDPAWGERLGERVVVMANHRLQNVDIRLSPAELGPLRVSVTIDDGAAQVSFVAQHAVTRDAIEQAMPRLRAMLEENGVNLGQASVEQDGPRDGKAEAQDGDGSAAAAPSAGEADAVEEAAGDAPVRLSRGLLDTFV